MHAAILCAAAFFSGFFAAPLPRDILVEQDVELISVVHCGQNCRLFSFFADVQDSWTLLAHRWDVSAVLYRDNDLWALAWQDDADECFRVVRAPILVESWEAGNPLAAENQGPWFIQLLEPGLAMPPRAEP